MFVRVKLTEKRLLFFKLKSKATIRDARGNMIEVKNKSFTLLSSGKKPELLYYPIILTTMDKNQSLDFVRAFKEEGYNLKIRERRIGKLSPVYTVYAGPFKDQREMSAKSPPGAVKVIKSCGNSQDVPVYFLIDGKKYTLYGKIKIQNNGSVELESADMSDGLYSNFRKDLFITSDLEVLPHGSNLSVIALVPIEEYVAGVVKSEIGDNAPFEAKKAQAVAARTNVIRKLWSGSGFEDYDISSSVFSQVYAGGDNFLEDTKKAVVETAGEILTYRGQPIEALFHAMCGGHTENSENVWSSYVPYLRGVFDEGAGHRRFPLNSERSVKMWINSNPDINCQKYGKKYWRWEFIYTSCELGKIIRSKTGKDIGRVLDIKVLERGVSGRAKKVKVTGSKGYVIIKRDLKIRRAFATTSLPSSLFYVEKRGNKFIIKGRGFGHGVGMCQIGAMGMADKGYDYKKILEHYYSHVKLEKIY